MSQNGLSRRDFHKLSMAALGGAMSGAVLVGCTPKAGDKAGEGGTAAAAEKHVCRGLNACKGAGAGGGNACAGQGACATSAKHTCAGQNECKGQGGCGETAGHNECKGKGGCAVPIVKDDMWKKARDKFEADMKAKGKTVGAAPAKA